MGVELQKRQGTLKSDTGADPVISSQSKMKRWIKEQEEHEREFPLSIDSGEYFQPMNSVPFSAEPRYEQDVVALFNQLLAGGVIRGIKLLATHQHEQYDGLFRYVSDAGSDIHKYDSGRNPLGVEEFESGGQVESEPFVLEYKQSFDGLVRDVERQTKLERDIDLVICWSMGKEWTKRYGVVSLLDPDHLHARPYHGLTHYVAGSGSVQREFYMIVLSDLINFLNDPEAEIKNQREAYGE